LTQHLSDILYGITIEATFGLQFLPLSFPVLEVVLELLSAKSAQFQAAGKKGAIFLEIAPLGIPWCRSQN